MGCHNQLFHICDKKIDTLLSEHALQHFLSKLYKRQCRKQIRKPLDTSLGSVMKTLGGEPTTQRLT